MKLKVLLLHVKVITWHLLILRCIAISLQYLLKLFKSYCNFSQSGIFLTNLNWQFEKFAYDYYHKRIFQIVTSFEQKKSEMRAMWNSSPNGNKSRAISLRSHCLTSVSKIWFQPSPIIICMPTLVMCDTL